MQTYQIKRDFYFDAGASSLGGTLVEPLSRPIPAQASVNLPSAGGFATSRTEAFNLDGLISCSAASTTVSGRKKADGSARVLVTAVVEKLNLLDVVTADRLVAQISVDIPVNAEARGMSVDDRLRFEPRRVSVLGSQFVGLRLGGALVQPCFAAELLLPKHGVNGSMANLTWEDFDRVGRRQASALVGCDASDGDDDLAGWLDGRFGWMTGDQGRDGSQCSLSSLFDKVTPVDGDMPGRALGHVIELPAFGRIFLGEILASRDFVQLTMVRAELGCAVVGSTSGGVVTNNGHMVPPVGSF
jgi:hypothetical protein